MTSSKRIFRIFDGANTTEVFPLNDSALSYTWEYDEKKIYYVQKLKTKFKFGNNSKLTQNDFDTFYNYHLNPLTTCLKLTFTVYKLCYGIETVEWVGEFSTVDGDFDLDKCIFSVKPNGLNIYSCLDKQKNVEINILDVPNIISTSANLDNNYEYFYCAHFGGSCSLPGPNPTAWTTFYKNFNYPYRVGCVTNNIFITIYYREFVITACVGGAPTPPMGAGWLLEQNDCISLSTSKYVRNPLAGPLPFTSQVSIGWYNLALGQDEEPPYPEFENIIVSANPASENLRYLYPTIVVPNGSSLGPTFDWRMEVPNNPNSTYVWSLDGTSPLAGSVTGVTNVVTIRPNSGASGNIIARLTETHGNASVSVKLYTIAVLQVGNANTGFTLTQNNIIGPSTSCKNQTGLRFSIPEQPIITSGGLYVATMGPITWSVTGGASIMSGQGTRFLEVDAGIANFNVSATWTVTVTNASSPAANYVFRWNPTTAVVITTFPITYDIFTITNRYPSEPNIVAEILTRNGRIYAWYETLVPTFLSNGTLSGGFNSYIIPTPASNGTFCYLVKESVNCDCPSFTKVGAGFPITIIPYTGMGYFPPIYWCYGNSPNSNIFYTRNRLFFEACEYILDQIDCSQVQIVSDFFEWNPPADTVGYVAGINYVTGLPNKLTHLTISQKSDVISPTSSNAATKGMLTFDKVTQIWMIMFECFWFIDNLNRIRVEHISWFNQTVLFDTTTSPNDVYNVAKRQYTFDKSKMPRFEKFLFAEQRTTDIAGAQIYYDSLCVNQDSKNNTEENALPFITTDLYFIAQSPSEINPQGFVLFCNDFNAGVYTVNYEIGNITGILGANFHLGWANLHVNYLRYRRVLMQGFMNNVLTNFFTSKRTKQQKDLILVICCSDNFNPSNILIRSALGDGILDQAEYTIKKGVMTISLLHNNNF